MATVEYDLDTSGGLMEEIQKLVAPPSSDEFSRRPRRRVREYRRQGRAVNHDCCDSCKEGGDLLCCDRCPAAFHLQCHDPPLEEDELPSGEWICHRCRVTPPQPEVTEDNNTPAPPPAPAPKPSTSRSRGRRRSQEEPMEIQDADEDMSHPLKMLAKAARLMNPVQFDLPKDVACTTSLPGSSKRRWTKEATRGPPKKLAHELDSGIVPLPAKLCFVCNKSCKKAPLIQCDYCPLLFHMDCLNPPLTSLPSGRWMCPNHAEHCLDEGLLKSVSLTERVKLWDHYTSSPVNQHTAKICFLKKIHRHSPPFRIKVKHAKRKSVQVPQSIKEHYSHPPALLPKPFSHVTPSRVDNWHGTPTNAPTLEEQDEWLTSVVSLQTSIAKYLAQKQVNKSPSASGSVCAGLSSSDLLKSVEITKPMASVSPVVQKDSSIQDSSQAASIAASCSSNTPLGVRQRATAAGCDSPDSMPFSNGPVLAEVGVKSGAVSLLNHAPNGEIGRTPPDGTGVVKTRSNSLDSAPVNVVKVSWPSGEKTCHSMAASTSPSITSKGKNIVISAINKANNTVITKVVSSPGSQGGKPFSNSATVKSVSSSASPTPSLVHVTRNPSSRHLGSLAASVNSVSSATSSGASKIITVTTTPQGVKSGACISSSSSMTKVTTVNSLSNSPTISSLNSTLQAYIEGNGETELSKLDDRLVQILAWQRLQQLLPSKAISNLPPIPLMPKKGLLNGLLSHQGSAEVQARALVCPLTGKGQPVCMPYRTLSIGTGADMDVCLNNFGTCQYVSAKHAVVFYDETSKHFELLNYSEHGTTVDNVLYSCDFSEKATTAVQPSSIVAAVRGVLKKGRKKKVEKEEKPLEKERLTMSGKAYEEVKTCSCKGSTSCLIGGSGAGWEGTALLHHGSYIKVGCLQFVFSIVEQAPLEPKPLDRRRESISLLKPPVRSQKTDS
ncbi:LOW QUALITY PROTEIN: PHD finger protein 12-like [Liolophura sinensis]|uniref:LOW QUALITY PROTEIN: PHD finger protein 12-like n=1 Tax=Liolophura sinensis TaxID=3198878 RepID=UPI003158BC87